MLISLILGIVTLDERIYVDETDFSNYLAIVDELNMSVMKIVQDAGAKFAQGAQTIMLENGPVGRDG